MDAGLGEVGSKLELGFHLYLVELADVHLVVLPTGPVLGIGLLAQLIQHETGHAFFTAKFCDYFGVERLPAMARAWGK